jgi:carboxyl-terminal processing protease
MRGCIIKSLLLILTCVAAMSWEVARAQVSERQRDEEIRRALEKISSVYEIVATRLADPVDPERAIFDGAIRGSLSVLDPFSAFLDSQQFQALEQQARGVQKGFGAILNVQSGSVVVLQSVPGSPFGRAGLGPGDRIVRINGHRVASLDLEGLVEVLQQARSARAHLSVLVSGKVVPEEFDLDPTEVPSPTVDKKFLISPQTGYLHVARIERGTPEEIKAVLEQWKGANLQGLILDLRDNPGGELEPAVAVAALFLREGQAVVSLQGRAVPAKMYSVDAPPLWRNLPLVVLMNGRTASAAEIIAAALQEHDRAWVVGEGSFGKGVVESVMPLREGAALALTTARYYTPQGRSVQKPVPGTALAAILPPSGKQFHSDSGRPLVSGGGVQPDQKAPSWQLDSWSGILGKSTAFVNFAQSYIERHGKVTDTFEVNDDVLSEFQSFLQAAGMEIPRRSWEISLPFLKVRIKTELFNLVFGVSKGDEVETRGDPQVQASRDALSQARRLLGLEDRNQTQGNGRRKDPAAGAAVRP